MKCPSCSKPVTMTDRYCIYCGCDLHAVRPRPGAAPKATAKRPTEASGASRRAATSSARGNTSQKDYEEAWGKYDTPSKKKKRGKKKGTPWFLIAIACVLLVAIVVTAVALLKRSDAPKVETQNPAFRLETQAPSSNRENTPESTEITGAYVLSSNPVTQEADGSYATESFMDVYTVLKQALAEGRESLSISNIGVSNNELMILLSQFTGDLEQPNYSEKDGCYILDLSQTRIGLKVLSAKKNGNTASLSAEEKKLLDKAEQVVSSSVKGMKSDREKARALFDTLLASCDLSAESGKDGADAALLNGSASSKGFADAYRLLCGLAGLDARCVSSTVTASGEVRVWNTVNIDGLWYAVSAAGVGEGDVEARFLMPLDRLRSEESWNEYTLPDGSYALN